MPVPTKHIHHWKKIQTNYNNGEPTTSIYECEDPKCRELREDKENVQLLLYVH